MQTPFHIAFQLGYKLYSIYELSFKQVPADIFLVTDKLPMDKLHKRFVFKELTVIEITGSNHEVQ